MRLYPMNRISACPLSGRLMDKRTPVVLRRGRLAAAA